VSSTASCVSGSLQRVDVVLLRVHVISAPASFKYVNEKSFNPDDATSIVDRNIPLRRYNNEQTRQVFTNRLHFKSEKKQTFFPQKLLIKKTDKTK